MANTFKITAKMSQKKREVFTCAFNIIARDLKLNGVEVEICPSNELGPRGIAIPGRAIIRNTRDLEDMMDTLAHEMRHLWQYQNRLLEEDTWMGKAYPNMAWKKRPWEWDATDYAKQVCVALNTMLS